MTSNIVLNPNIQTLGFLSSPDPKLRAFHSSLPFFTPTPLISLPVIAKELGITHLLVKDESTRLGLSAFKILGASWATYKTLIKELHLTESNAQFQTLSSAAQAASLTLYAATDGNHGRAVARMAKYLGIEAKILVPKMLDEEAKSKIESEGAKVQVFQGDYDETVLAAKASAESHVGGKGILISDTALEFGDETAQWIVDGYQTMFDEIEEQILDITGTNRITHVVTPVGVGSLSQAVVTHFGRTERAERTRVIAVEPKTAACLQESLKQGKMISVQATYTICTGMCCGTLSASAWPILKDGVGVSVVVDDEEVHQAVVELEEYNVLAGPCGAASLAGLRHLAKSGAVPMGTDAVIVLLCTEAKRGYVMMS